MCHLSPTVHLSWAILSGGLQIFLIQHLWRYDRFKCLTWSSGRQPGAFKRVMTYSYCASVPSLLVYSVSMAVLKYRNGYTFIPGHGIIPTPYQLWSSSDRAWLIPLFFLFSITWGLELQVPLPISFISSTNWFFTNSVTHLEELMFWLFLLHQGPTRRDWFSSIEFRAWATASFFAMVGMPLTAVFTRSDPLRAEAYIFLVGGVASTSVTTVFFIVLAKFPEFLRRVKREGAAGPVVLRLVKFHELNVMRVIFRLLFTLPLITLGVDGVLSHHVVNESPLWTDFLAFLASVGAVISSTLTLLIFFPRSLAEDSNWRPRTTDSFVSGSTSRGVPIRPTISTKASYTRDPGYSDGNPFSHTGSTSEPTSSYPMVPMSKSKYSNSHFTAPSALTTPYYPPSPYAASVENSPATGVNFDLREMENGDAEDRKTLRRVDSETALMKTAEKAARVRYGEEGAKRVALDDAQSVRMIELGRAVEAGLKPPRPPRPQLHPYIMSFTSPIDLLHPGDDGPRAI